ncbi:MAG: hypothetical protein GC181_05005 [Bacteroidetes bacterium]|nr:hypothetical protein [Bacteroidota bacterium]
MAKPSPESIPVYYRPYLEKVKSANVLQALDEGFEDLRTELNTLNKAQFDFAYAPEKWTVKQVLQHLLDSERIMSYRALRFARGDRTELPGFDQNEYVNGPGIKVRSIQSMKNELLVQRNCTRLLFESFTPEELKREGIANGYVMSVNAIGFIITGHTLHHYQILRDRYFAAENFPT